MDLFSHLTQFDYHHTLEDTPGVALVLFTSRSCPSCRAWRKTLAGYRARNPELIIFEVDCEQELALVREFEVFHLPALFLYRDGNFHRKLQCAADLASLKACITDALGQHPEESP